MSRFLREPVSVRNAASVIVVATLVIVVAGGVAIRILDHHEYSSIWDGMWWALQTVTTVGYGDVTPKNAPGRFVGAFVMLEGIAFLAIVTAAITSTFVARAEAQRDADGAGGGGARRGSPRFATRGPVRAHGSGRAAADQAHRGVTRVRR